MYCFIQLAFTITVPQDCYNSHQNRLINVLLPLVPEDNSLRIEKEQHERPFPRPYRRNWITYHTDLQQLKNANTCRSF